MSSIPIASIHAATSESILWRGDFLPGHEACRLYSTESQRHLEGASVFSHEGLPCCLDYHILCDGTWRTLSVKVEGWVGNSNVSIHLAVTPEGHWQLNGVDQLGLTGCIDVDLNFSPATNLLPIRRLNLKVGETAEVRAAWLKFPGFQLEPLVQKYQCLEEHLFRYESASGFTADLKVNDLGFVLNYPGGWKTEVMYENTRRDQA